MKLKYLAIALFPFALAACQSSDIQNLGNAAMSVLQQQNADKVLPSYHWSTVTDKSIKPLELNFSKDGNIHIQSSCNALFGGYAIQNNMIVPATLASTMIGCTGAPAEQEAFAGQLFGQEKIPFTLNIDNPEQPTLTLVTAKGEKVVFTGKMTPETKYQTQAETIFFEVNPKTVQCQGVAPQTCLQVREIKYDDKGIKTQVDKDWTLFYDKIEGFEHRPDEKQIIRVKRYEIKNPAADQSKYAYVFDMTVARGTLDSSL